MTGTPLAIPPWLMAFLKSYGTQSLPLPRTHVLGSAMETALGGTSSLDSPSAWFTCYAVTWRLACDASCVVMRHGGDGGPT